MISSTNLPQKLGDLHDGDVWALLHLECGVHEAVLRNPRIGIDKENDLSTERRVSQNIS